jgi:hypothetical protein
VSGAETVVLAKLRTKNYRYPGTRSFTHLLIFLLCVTSFSLSRTTPFTIFLFASTLHFPSLVFAGSFKAALIEVGVGETTN